VIHRRLRGIVCSVALVPVLVLLSPAVSGAGGTGTASAATSSDSSAGASRLTGAFTVAEDVTASVNNADPVGFTRNADFSFVPACTSGSCEVQMTRWHANGTTTSYSINPKSNGSYSGQTTYNGNCIVTGVGTIPNAYTVTENITITPKVTSSSGITAFTGVITTQQVANALGAQYHCAVSSETIHLTGTMSCSAPTAVGAVSGAGFARIQWTAGESNGCTITAFRVSDGATQWTTGPNARQLDVSGLANHSSYVFSVSTISTAVMSAFVAANKVTPEEPNYCPGNDRKLTVAKTDDNVAGNTFWRVEDDLTWCTRFGVATYNSQVPTGYTAWTDKIGFSWLAGPVADVLNQFVGLDIAHSCKTTKPSLVQWPTAAGQTVSVTTYPCFAMSEHFLTAAMTAATLGEGTAEKSVGEEIVEEGPEWLEAHEAEVKEAVGGAMLKLVKQYGALDSPILKKVFGKALSSVIDAVVLQMTSIIINVMIGVVAGFNTLASLYKWLDQHTTGELSLNGTMVININPHGTASASTTYPYIFPPGTLSATIKTTTP
jgi:hypothetical protein